MAPFLAHPVCMYVLLTRDAMHPRNEPWPRVCLSVRLSVCPSQVGVLLKRLNVGSHKQHHTIAQDSSFLLPKISAKFDRRHHLRGHQMQVGWVKIGDLRQITGCISKTVQDRHIVSIRGGGFVTRPFRQEAVLTSVTTRSSLSSSRMRPSHYCISRVELAL